MKSSICNHKTIGVSVVALCAAMAPAFAQEADVETTSEEADRKLNTVMVTGFRQSLAEALDIKKEETGFVDAIVADDIADFPDLNLAESLQRIPGVAINRQAGEGRQITVRGLDGRFTRVQINGMDALATGGGSDASGGTNRSRTFDFNTFAAELFNELVVRKSQSASVEEGSLGANVELRTARPFDYDEGFTFSASAQGLYNDLNEDMSPRLTGLASYTNQDKTFGGTLSIAYQDREITEEGFSSVRFDDRGTFRSVLGDTCVGVDPLPANCQTLFDAYYPRIPRYGRLSYDQQRLGITGSLQFQPSDSTVITLDGLFSELDGSRQENFLEIFIRSNTDNLAVTDFNVNSNGVIDYLEADILADVSNGIVPARSETRRDDFTTTFEQISVEVEHDFSDTLTGTFFAGTSSSEFDNPLQATFFFDAAQPVSGYSIDFRGDLEQPSIDFGDFDVTSANSYLLTQWRNRPQGSENDFETIRGDLEYDWNDNVTLSAGLSFKNYDFATREVRLGGNIADLGFGAPLAITPDLQQAVTGFGSGIDGNIDSAWLGGNIDALLATTNITAQVGDISSRPQSNRAVSEESVGGYVQAAFETEVGGMPIRGDIGARYVETTTASSGFLNLGSGFELVTVERSYDDFLPSLNVVFEATDEFWIRAGISRVMSRPELGDLTPGGSLDIFNGTGTSGDPFELSQGNPALDPFRATALDLSAEYYFADESLIAVSVFHKDIESFFQESAETLVPFSATGLPQSVAGPISPLRDALDAGLDPIVAVSQTENGSDASVSGIEIVYQQPLTFLPVEGFGFTGNYTYVDSDEITNISPVSYNATLYYENDKFDARISGSYRDAFQTRSPRSDGREERGVAETFNVDFASSYKINENFELSFEAINLTDEFEHQTFDRLELPTLYHHTGRNFLFGVRATY